MEREFRIHWPLLVEEARFRRKRQRLTQQRLALLADVSTPTVSRFENGEKNIQLSSALAIFTVLGMTDQRTLRFPEGQKMIYNDEREIVQFVMTDGTQKIRCAISKEALEDHCDPGGKDLLQIFQQHRPRIEHTARRLYFTGRLEKDGTVLIRTADLRG